MEEEGEYRSTGADHSDAIEVANQISEGYPSWRPDVTIHLGSVSWQPSLVRIDDEGKITAVLHVHLADSLRSYLLQRMTAAAEQGVDVHVATPLAALYDEELLRELVQLDVQLHLIDSLKTAESRSVLTCI